MSQQPAYLQRLIQTVPSCDRISGLDKRSWGRSVLNSSNQSSRYKSSGWASDSNTGLILQDQGLQPLQINEYCSSNLGEGKKWWKDDVRFRKFSAKKTIWYHLQGDPRAKGAALDANKHRILIRRYTCTRTGTEGHSGTLVVPWLRKWHSTWNYQRQWKTASFWIAL